VRTDAELARGLDHEVDLARAVDHDVGRAAEPLRQQRRLDVGAVLVAIADDQRLGRVEQRQRHQQLGLGAGLEADPQRRAVLDDLLHHVALLVHLDRVHAPVHTLVPVLGHRLLEAPGDALHARGQDVREADQHRLAQPAALEVLHQLEQVDLVAAVAARSHRDVSRLVDREEARAPGRDAVQLEAVLDGPTAHSRALESPPTAVALFVTPSSPGCTDSGALPYLGRGSLAWVPLERSRTITSPRASSSGPIR
jgi:hypothetical protein